MKVNWPEQVWVNSPLRIWMQLREMRVLKSLRPLPPGSEILEIGCGRGVGAQLVGRMFEPARIEAIDIDPRMINLASKRRLGLAIPVTFRVADAQELPFGDESMDAVFNFGIIHHLEDWQRGLREVARVLRPGGSFYFEEIYPDLYANAITGRILRHPTENRFDGPQFRSEMETVGLELVDGYRETRYRIIAVAVKNARPVTSGDGC